MTVAAARDSLRLRHAALEGEKNQVGTAADSEFAEKIGDVKLYRAFGDVEFAGDFFVGKIFEQRVENFLLATARLVTVSVLRRRPWPLRMESTKPESS